MIQAITNADYADDIAGLTNTPTQAEFLLAYSAAGNRWHLLYVNADKTECIGFDQKEDIY